MASPYRPQHDQWTDGDSNSDIGRFSVNDSTSESDSNSDDLTRRTHTATLQIPALLASLPTATSLFHSNVDALAPHTTKERIGRALCSMVSPRFGMCEELTAAQLIVQIQKHIIDPETASNSLLPLWVDVQVANEMDILMIIESLNLHPTTVDDLVNDPIREKWMKHKNYCFLSFHEIVHSQRNPQLLDIICVKFLICPGVMFTFHSQTSHGILDALNLLKNHEYYAPTEGWYLFLVLRCLTRSYTNRCRILAFEVESIDELVLALSASSSDNRDLMMRIQAAKLQLNILSHNLEVKIDLMADVLASRVSSIADILPYFGSISDILVKLKYKVQFSQESLEMTVGNYLTSVEIDDARSSQKTNYSIQKLTVLSTIMLPLGLITGLFGMNVEVPGAGLDTLRWFGGIILIMIALAVVLVWSFRRINFLEK